MKALSIGISYADWHRLFDFCKRQALAGIFFSAVEMLHQQGIQCPVSLKMKLMALTLQIGILLIIFYFVRKIAIDLQD